MLFNEFIKINEKIWHNYFREFFERLRLGEISLEEGTILFPNIALFTETKEHYIMELLGAKKDYIDLKTKKHKEISTEKYLYQFEFGHTNFKDSLVQFDGIGSGLKYLTLSRPVDLEVLKKRFKSTSQWSIGTSFIRTGMGNGSLFSFGENFKSAYMDNCVLVNRLEEIYRVKQVVHMVIVNKNYSTTAYEDELRNRLNGPVLSTTDLFGIQYCVGKETEAMMLSGQFANTFLIPGLRETTIGEFLNQNPSFIESALNCKDFLYEPDFKWIEGNPDLEEKAINPDIMLRRNDGYYDICDLKTPKLYEKKLVKGRHKRRAFVSYVDEGISQLANYEEYFTFQANKEVAKDKYSVEVVNPTLYLVVGNYENLTPEEIREAARKLKPNYRIIDYDTLNALYLSKYLT
ncbi:DUF4263 domain-containing protein [Bacillus cereus group sp. Bc200]|uniref:Shedu anti-phage system protein SduA domain-containing protein n=1 Tax=Bacillus cereus group sp. Bc200 TaxID=3018112 RepID=UPI0022E2C66F|nr:Shedu anti-phage system protein SduA domain-containing protein [Bacillus cereus group sp. Bc200]MDA2261318.1 DUF4263 domain-containing protein [Bacillus cereus group sp. Bc200]